MGKRTKTHVCFITGIEKPQNELLHLVVSPSNEWVIDFSGELMEVEGCWITNGRSFLSDFEGSVDRKNQWPEVMGAERLDALALEQFRRRPLSLLGIAQKSGEVITGNDKIESVLKKSKKGILIQASDASVEGKLKLQYNARGCSRIIDQVYSREELSRILGKDNAVHVWLKESRIARAFMEAFMWFETFEKR